MYFECSNSLNNHKKKSNNSTFVILIFEISKSRNIGRSTFLSFQMLTPTLVKDGCRKIYILLGGGQNLERRNVERPIFRNFKITNIKITKDELLDNFSFRI